MKAMAKILVAGGTGLIGTPLVERLLQAGYEVVLLTRRPAEVRTRHERLRPVLWDGKTLGAWASEAESAKAIINLCGSGIADERWTDARKLELLNSRIHPLQALVQAAVRAADPPKAFITASAVGYYGDLPPDEAVTETHRRGLGFLAETCGQWEKASETAAQFGIRTIWMRFGVVLALGGGALPKFLPPFKAYVGGPLGSGRQIVPWIHRDDAVSAVLHALEHHSLTGPVNVTAPHLVPMKDFCSELGKALGRPSWLPVPGFVLKALMGESAQVVLEGQRALPRKLMDSGFKFKHPDLASAFKNLLGA